MTHWQQIFLNFTQGAWTFSFPFQICSLCCDKPYWDPWCWSLHFLYQVCAFSYILNTTLLCLNPGLICSEFKATRKPMVPLQWPPNFACQHWPGGFECIIFVCEWEGEENGWYLTPLIRFWTVKATFCSTTSKPWSTVIRWKEYQIKPKGVIF